MGNHEVDLILGLFNKGKIASLKTTFQTGVDSLQNAATTELNSPQYHSTLTILNILDYNIKCFLSFFSAEFYAKPKKTYVYQEYALFLWS